MQANPRKLLDLFGNSLRYVVPIFQRHYTWSQQEQWYPLWEDICEKLDLRLQQKRTQPHFFGALILDQVRKLSTKEVSRFLVIDGQQRLTTVQILLAAMRDQCTEYGVENLSKALTRHLINPDPELMQNPDEEIYKLWPTQFNRKIFCDVISAGSKQIVEQKYPLVKLRRKRKYEPRDRIVEAYLYFYAEIDNLLTGYDTDDLPVDDLLLELYGVLKDDFAVVEILLDENDDAQEIFHSLNSQGKPLSPSDLLRSYIFMRAEKSHEDRDRLYEKYWRYFEHEFWDAPIRLGALTVTRLDATTRTFLASKLGTVVDSKKIHLTYRNWIANQRPYASIEDELRDFYRYGVRYANLLGWHSTDSFSAIAKKLRTWDVSTSYPLVSFLIEESGLSSEDLNGCLLDLESFIVRRLICNKQNKEYNKYFLEIISKLREEGVSRRKFQEILRQGRGDTREWPNDESFKQAWLSNAVYSVIGNDKVNLILLEIEYRLRTSKSENVSINHSLSIEHIMPKKWATNYKLGEEFVPANMANGTNWYFSTEEERNKWNEIRVRVQERNNLIDTFGNLTLVTQPLNSAMSNAAFAEKKQKLEENSVLLLNRYSRDLSQWTETEIRERSIYLFKTACEIWRYPS